MYSQSHIFSLFTPSRRTNVLSIRPSHMVVFIENTFIGKGCCTFTIDVVIPCLCPTLPFNTINRINKNEFTSLLCFNLCTRLKRLQGSNTLFPCYLHFTTLLQPSIINFYSYVLAS